MKLTRLAGGARAFGVWVDANFSVIKCIAESTTRFGKLLRIQQHGVSKMRFLRFIFSTGDASGQNMGDKATGEAYCQWIIAQKPEGLSYFALAGNTDSDEKSSALNILSTRGKRVVAEVTIPRYLLSSLPRVTPELLDKSFRIGAMGAWLSQASSTSTHTANVIAAMFIGRSNFAESFASYAHLEVSPNGDWYISLTIPSLIVATQGGGTSLPAQRECFELLDCYGPDKVGRFAEVVAATCLCGDIALLLAVLTGTWIPSHDTLGRNRGPSNISAVMVGVRCA